MDGLILCSPFIKNKLKIFCLNFTLLGNSKKKLLRPLDIHNFISYLELYRGELPQL